MDFLIRSAMVFFGTLMAAGLVALSEPFVAGALPGHEARTSIEMHRAQQQQSQQQQSQQRQQWTEVVQAAQKHR